MLPILDREIGCLKLVQAPLAPAEIAFADLRQANAAGRTLQQTHIECLFQFDNLVAHPSQQLLGSHHRSLPIGLAEIPKLAPATSAYIRPRRY